MSMHASARPSSRRKQPCQVNGDQPVPESEKASRGHHSSADSYWTRTRRYALKEKNNANKVQAVSQLSLQTKPGCH